MMGALVYNCREEIERAINRLRDEGATWEEISAALLAKAGEAYRNSPEWNDTE
jgi:FtsZ-binding cell division protein ZapB